MKDLIDNEESISNKGNANNVLIVIEKVLFSFSILGICFGVLHWPGKTMLFILGLGGLNLFLITAGWFYKSWALKVTNVSLSFLLVSLLFKMMVWPGETIFWLIGWGLFLPLTIVFFVITVKMNSNFWIKNKYIYVRTIFFTSFFILLCVLPFDLFFTTFVKNDTIAAHLYAEMKHNPTDRNASLAFLSYWSKSRGYSNSTIQSTPFVTDTTIMQDSILVNDTLDAAY